MRLCPWADAVYGCDGPWWKARNGLPEYDGLKLAHDTSVCAAFADVHKIEIDTRDKLQFDHPGLIGNGGNSGFQALNIAIQFGATQIVLVGFDMHTGSGLHWYGSNTWRAANNPTAVNLMRWRDGFEKNAPLLRGMGIDVVNASPDSSLVCFPHKSLDDVMTDWG